MAKVILQAFQITAAASKSECFIYSSRRAKRMRGFEAAQKQRSVTDTLKVVFAPASDRSTPDEYSDSRAKTDFSCLRRGGLAQDVKNCCN
jgi:hypothetical protein